MNNSGKKFDQNKPATQLIPVSSLMGAGRGFSYGHGKYDDSDRANENNWRGGMLWSRVYGALLRHLYAFWDGEDFDSESGLPHLDHAMCNLMMLYEYTTRDQYEDNDDRPVADPEAWTVAALPEMATWVEEAIMKSFQEPRANNDS